MHPGGVLANAPLIRIDDHLTSLVRVFDGGAAWRVALVVNCCQLLSHLLSHYVPSDSQLIAERHDDCNVGGARSSSGR